MSSEPPKQEDYTSVTPAGDFISSVEAASEFGYSNDHIARICRLGEVACERNGKLWKVSRASLRAYVEATLKAQEERRQAQSERFRKELNSVTPSRTVFVPRSVEPSPYETFTRTVATHAAIFFLAFAISVPLGQLFHSVTPSRAFEMFSFDVLSREQRGAVLGVQASQLALSFHPSSWISALSDWLWGEPQVYVPPPVIRRELVPTSAVIPTSSTPTTIVQNITQPLTISGVSTELLTARLQTLENALRSEIYLYSARAERGVSGNYRAIQLSQVINNLDGVTITNPIISGGSISGTSGLGATSLDGLSDVVLSSVAYGNVLLHNGTEWVNVATSSLGITGGGGSSFGQAFELSTNTFGQSALAPTTTQNIAVSGVGTSTFAGGLEAWRQIASPYFNATSTSATSTFAGGLAVSGGLNLFGTFGNSWDDFCTSITGGSGLCDGTDNTGGGSGLATSTDIVDTYVIYGTSASDVGAEAAFTYDDATDKLTVVNASTTNISSSYASSTQAFFGSLNVGSLTGFLKATAGVVATSLIDLANDVGSSILAVANGGTGWAELQANTLLLGNGTSRVATTSAGTNGQILSLVSGVPSWVATTTFNTPLNYAAGAVTLDTSGTWSGTASLASALAANGANCSSGNAPLGVDAGGAVEGCFDVWTEAENTSAAYTPQSRSLTIAGTANQITSSAGAQDLSGDRTWTLSIPSLFSINLASTTGLSALGNLYAGNGTATTTIIGNATSTFGAGIEATYLNITGTAATSTFARGIDLAGGCFAINGTCVGGGSGSPGGSDGQLQYNNGGSFGGAASVYYDDVNNLLGIGTTSPWAKLAVNPVAGDTNQFVVGSSTATSFLINSAGNIAVGNTSGVSSYNFSIENFNSTQDPSVGGLQGLAITNKNNTSSSLSGINFRAYDTTDVARHGAGIVFGKDGAWTGGSGTYPGFLAFWTREGASHSEKVRITSTGNVGIGSTSPWAKLAVNPVAGDTNQFVVGSSTATSFLINSAGSVGVGQVAPAALLHVGGTASAGRNFQVDSNGRAIIRFDDNSSNTVLTLENRAITAAAHGTGIDFKLETAGSPGVDAVRIRALAENATHSGATADGALVFSTALDGTLGERFRITSAGNVGIGTTSPIRALTIANAEPAVVLEETDASANNRYWRTYASSGTFTIDAVDDGFTAAGEALRVNRSGTTVSSFILPNGNIGIATSTPWRKLSVADAVATAQFALAYDTTRYATFQVTSVGDLVIDAQGDDVSLLDENLYVCTGGSCPSAPSGTGHLIVEGQLVLPNGTAPTVNAVGSIALDTTDNQLLIATSTNASFPAVFPLEQPLFSLTVGSTTPEFISSGTIPIGKWVSEGREITRFSCFVKSGTSKVVNVTDGTNDTETITCATTHTADTSVDTNATFTAGELWYLEFGATSGAVDYVTFTAYGHLTRE